MFYLKELQRQGELPAAASLPKWLQRQELYGSGPGSFFQVSNVGRGAQAPGPFSTAFPGHQQGKVEPSGLETTLIRNASATGSWLPKN